MSGQESSPASRQAPQVKGFTLIKKLGSGKSADVYLANQECFDRKVALKILHASLNDDPGFKKRFFEKVKLIKQLSHPHLAEVYSVGESEGRTYLVMEYFPGGNLAKKIENLKKLSAKECAQAYLQVSEAISYCHQKGILHGNLHNKKIYIRDNGKIALSDYVLARAQIKGKLFNSIHHISPEQLQGQKPSKAVDYYAMGICCYQALTGTLPFTGNSAKDIANQHINNRPAALPEETSSFQDVIDGLLNKDPQQRTANHEALAPDLLDIIQQAQQEKVTSDTIQLSSVDDFEPGISSPLKSDTPSTTIAAESLNANKKAATNSEEQADIDAAMAALEKSSSPKVAIAGIAALLLSAALGSWYYINMDTAAPAAVVTPTTTITPEPIQEDPTQQRIERLLAKAEILMDAGKYTQPIGNNAYGKYQLVLEKDSRNPRALDGIQRITAKLLQQAHSKINKNQLKPAKKIITIVKAIDKHAKGLSEAELALNKKMTQQAARQAEKSRKANDAWALKQRQAQEAKTAEQARIDAEEEKLARLAAEKQLQQELAEEQRQQAAEAQANITMGYLNKLKVNGLLRKADTYYKRGEFHSPAQENALEKYMQVLLIDANNQIARQGLIKVVDTIVPEIQAFLDQQQYSMAKNLYDQAITATPNHSLLKKLGQSKGW
ncbi:MAG: protein kinase [Pseudomonadales bacterium]|nr:protein kinase [Pseudomonadales bacterium]